MPESASRAIEQGVIEAIQSASRRPIEPALDHELVADLGFDSLQVLDVVAELEGRFDIAIPLEAVPAARTVGQVVAQVARLVEARADGDARSADAR
jgi:acyl carrier protein